MIRNVPPLLPTADVFEQHFALGQIPSLDGGRVLQIDSREGAHELATYVLRSYMEANQTADNLRVMKDRRIPVPRDYLLMFEQQNLMIGKLWQLAGEVYRQQRMAIDDLPLWITSNRISLSAVVMLLRSPDATAGVQFFENWNGNGFPMIVDGPRAAVQYGPFTTPDHWIAIGREFERQALEAIRQMGGEIDYTERGAAQTPAGPATSPPRTKTPQPSAGSQYLVHRMGVAPVVVALWIVAAAAAGGAAYGAYRLITDPAGTLRFAARVLQSAGLTNRCVNNALQNEDRYQSAAAVENCLRQTINTVASGLAGRIGRAVALPAVFMLVGGIAMLTLLGRTGQIDPIGRSRRAPAQLHISVGQQSPHR